MENWQEHFDFITGKNNNKKKSAREKLEERKKEGAYERYKAVYEEYKTGKPSKASLEARVPYGSSSKKTMSELMTPRDKMKESKWGKYVGKHPVHQAKAGLAASARMEDFVPRGVDIGTGDYMTPQEKGVYAYYKNKGQEKQARAYLSAISTDVNKRAAEDIRKEAKEKAEKSVALGLLDRYTAGISAPMGVAYTLYKNAVNEPIDPNHPAFWGEHKLEGNTEGFTGNDKFMKRAVKEAALGAFDWVSQASTFGAMGLSGKALGTATAAAYGTKAFSGNAKDAAQRGGTARQALGYGAIGAAAEVITEKIGFDKWIKLGNMATSRKGLAQAVKAILPGTVSEAAEEATSEIANLVADYAIMGDKSQYKKDYANAIAQGKTEKEAQKEAVLNGLKQIGYSGFVGGLSGGMIGGGTYGASRIVGKPILGAYEEGPSFRERMNGQKEAASQRETPIQQDIAGRQEEIQPKAVQGQQAASNVQMHTVDEFGKKYYHEHGQAVVRKFGERREGDPSFIPAFQTYYRAGLTGLQEKYIQQTAETLIADRELLTEAYLAGVEDRKADVEERLKGKSRLTGEAGIILKTEAVTEEQRAFAELMANTGGMEVVLVDKLQENGNYQKGRITVALNSDSFTGTLFHESVHYIREANPKGYDKMQKMVFEAAAAMEKLGQMSVEEYILKYQDAYGAYADSYGDILEEMTADAFQKIAADEEGMRKFIKEIEGREESKGFLEQIKAFVDKLLTTLKGLLIDNRFSDFAEDINRDIRFTEGLRKVFAEELARAKEERERAEGEIKTEELEKEQSKIKTEKQGDIVTEDEEGNKIRYSIKENISKQIRKAMEDSAEFTQSHVYLGETPQNLVDILGLRKLPMLMSKKKVYLVTRAEGKYTGKKANYHNLGVEGLEQAIEAIKNPAIIMESMSVEGSIVIITEVKDKEGAPVIVAVHPNSKGNYQEILIDTNTVTSVYGKNIDFTEWLTDFINQDKLLWIDNKKSRQFLMNSVPRVQFPSGGAPVSFDSNIARFQETVKKLDEKKKALEEEAQRKREEKQRKQEEKEEARAAWLEKMRKEKAERDKQQEEEDETQKAKMSIRASELAVLQKENEKLSAINENLRKQFTITKGIVFDEVTAEKAVRKWLKSYKSKADAKEVTEKVMRIAKEMREGKIPQGEQVVGESEDFVISENAFITGQSALYILAEEVLEKSEDLDRSAAEEHRDLLDKLKKTKIKVGESLKEELDYYGGYNNIRKANFGKVNLSQKEGIPIDSFYLELAEMYPEFFNEEKQRAEGDMMMRILDVVEELRPTVKNPFGDNMKEAAEEASRELFTIAQDIQLASPTFADKYESKLQELRSEYAEYKKIARKAAKQNQSRVEKLERQQEKRKEQKERERYRLARRETEKTAKSLLSWIENPTDKYHVPQSMLSCTLSFLQKLDTANADITIKQQDLMNIYKEMMARQEDLKNEGYFIAVPEEFSEMITSYWNSPQKEHLEEWEQTMYISEEGMKLSEFTADQMENLKNTLKMLKRMIQDVNRLASSKRNETVSNLARGFLAEGEKKKKIRQDGKLKKAWDFFNLDMVDAPSFFKMLGKGVYDTLYSGYRHGMNKKINLLHEGISFMNKTVNQETIRKWRKEEQKTFTFTRGTGEQQKEISITLSVPQIMSLYCLNKRAAGRRHIYNGGIKADTGILKGKKAQKQYEGVQLFPEEIGEILGTLTDEQKEAAKKVQKYFSTNAAAWGNEVTMDLFGYKKYNDPLYFPIVADKTYVNEVIGMERGDRTLKSMGMTKNVNKHAKNPLVLQDIFSVYSRHIDQMSSYAAFVPVLQDTNKFINYKELGEGQEAKNRSVKETMKGFLGDSGLKFLDKLMQQINGTAKGEDNGLTKFSRGLLRNMKTAAVGANLRVVVQQPTAIIRAANMINPMYLTMAKPGLLMTKKDYETMYQYAPIARWKDWGYYETNVGKSVEDMVAGESISSIGAMKNRIVNASMWGAGVADKITWGQIWNACVAEAKHKHKGMTEEEIYEMAGERFTAIIDETQVVDSPLHRSQLMRDKNLFTQMATSFMAEPTKTYNMFRTAWYDFVQEPSGKNGMKTSKTAAILAMNAITTAVAAGLLDAVRDDDEEDYNKKWVGYFDRMKRALLGDWRKKEEMNTLDKIRTFLGSNIVEGLNPAAYLPITRDLLSLIQGFDVGRTDMAGVADILRSCTNLMRYIEGESQYTFKAIMFDFFGSFSKFTGIPIYTVEREFTSFKNSYIGLFSGLEQQYDNKTLRYNIRQEKNTGMYVQRIIEANLAGNKNLATKIYNDMVKAGINNETLNTKIGSKEKEALKELPEMEKAAEAYISTDMDTLTSLVDGMTAKGYSRGNVVKVVQSMASKMEKGEDEEEQTFDTIDNSFWQEDGEEGEDDSFVNYEMLFRAYMNGSEDYGALWEGLNAIGKEDKKIKQSMRDRLSTAYAKAVVEGDYETYEKAMKEFYRLGGKSDTLENKVQKEKERRGME